MEGLLVVSFLLILAGMAGSILPALPGPPLSFAGLLLLQFTEKYALNWVQLLVIGAVVLAVSILDYYLPLWVNKKAGGTSAGRNGALIGMLIGFIFTPIGMVVGMMVGALVGELIHDHRDFSKAIRGALSSLMGFLLGSGLKLVACMAMLFVFLIKVFF